MDDREGRLFSAVPDRVTAGGITGRSLLLLVLLAIGLPFLFGGPRSQWIANHFLHGVDLAIHEAGHVVFSPFGWFLGVAGGSLLQLLMPALFAGAFLFKYRDPFGASVTVWWLGQNFMDLAPYVDDARSQTLMLLGGVTGRDAPGYHDWNNILAHLDLLAHDHTIARLFYDGGRVLMAGALIWGVYLVLLQRQVLRSAQ